MDRPRGARMTRRTPSKISGRNAHENARGQRMKNERSVVYIHAAAAISETDSRHPSSRAKRKAPRPAMKKAIAAVYVMLFATGSRHARSVNGLYAAGCAAAARMSPERMNGLWIGH